MLAGESVDRKRVAGDPGSVIHFDALVHDVRRNSARGPFYNSNNCLRPTDGRGLFQRSVRLDWNVLPRADREEERFPILEGGRFEKEAAAVTHVREGDAHALASSVGTVDVVVELMSSCVTVNS